MLILTLVNGKANESSKVGDKNGQQDELKAIEQSPLSCCKSIE